MDGFNLFATPVMVFKVDDVDELNRELATRLLAESETRSGLRRSNTGGWHSTPDLSQRPDECFQTLMRQVARHAQIVLHEVARARGQTLPVPYRVGLQGWAMVIGPGGYSVVHDHAHAHWSVVYYVDAGDADLAAHPQSGQLVLLDPRRAVADISGVDLFPTHFGIQPVTGMLVFFPGAIQHYVHPYRGTRPRVSISCNVRYEPETPP